VLLLLWLSTSIAMFALVTFAALQLRSRHMWVLVLLVLLLLWLLTKEHLV
jgi:hypothetical protein